MSTYHPRPAKRQPQGAGKKKSVAAPPPPVQKNMLSKFLSGISKFFKKSAGSGQTQTGVVKFFSRSKGFGFIQDENGTEIFVHISGLKSEIRVSDKVTFTTAQGKRGLTAVNVTVV